MKKIILYILLGLCILGIIPLVLTASSNQSSVSGSSEKTYTITFGDYCYDYIHIYDENGYTANTLIHGHEYKVSFCPYGVDNWSLYSLTLNGVEIENNSTFIAVDDVFIEADYMILWSGEIPVHM